MTMTFQEAMEKINNGIILACPVCFDGLEIDEKAQRMYCPKHGEYVSPNVKLTGRGPES
ncbi:MAG: hypothetical protein Q8L15_04435 [Methylobacter sp.]|nr:hypothetical protein [Methylobacter sp.]